MTYEFDGREYEKASAHQQEWGNRLISELNLTGNERILDLGCGPGLYTKRLSDAGYDVTGMDYSRRSIAYAKEHDTETRYIYR
ncbi:MAG TPA: class I SAM-dependent methyltransferase, partial [Deltaproteobacteria bacterium]|nr:class I SAM-dependent methyltransferase [Deltaproteobacteria bacterium]